jgi:hypothetical protein
MRQYMHQQLLHAPLGPNRSSRAGHRSGVSGRILSCIITPTHDSMLHASTSAASTLDRGSSDCALGSGKPPRRSDTRPVVYDLLRRTVLQISRAKSMMFSARVGGRKFARSNMTTGSQTWSLSKAARSLSDFSFAMVAKHFGQMESKERSLFCLCGNKVGSVKAIVRPLSGEP